MASTYPTGIKEQIDRIYFDIYRNSINIMSNMET